MGRVENIRGMIGILNYCMKNIYTCVKICIMYCIRLMIKDSDNSSSNHHKGTSAIIVLIIMISDKIDVKIRIYIYIYKYHLMCLCIAHIPPNNRGHGQEEHLPEEVRRAFSQSWDEAIILPALEVIW